VVLLNLKLSLFAVGHHLINQFELFHLLSFFFFLPFLLFFLLSFFFLILSCLCIFSIVEHFIVDAFVVETADNFLVFGLGDRFNLVIFLTCILAQNFRNRGPILRAKVIKLFLTFLILNFSSCFPFFHLFLQLPLVSKLFS